MSHHGGLTSPWKLAEPAEIGGLLGYPAPRVNGRAAYAGSAGERPGRVRRLRG